MGSKTTTKTDNNPPAWAKKPYETAGSEVQRLYDSGEGGNPWMGSTVSDLSDTTMSGVNQLARAGQSWNTAGTRPLYQGLGTESVSDPFVNRLSRLAGGIQGGQTDMSGLNAQNVGDGDFQGILGRAQGPTAASRFLTDTASGKMLNGNPHLDDVIGRASKDITGGANMMASAAGRYGSGGHQAVTQNAIGDMSSDLRYQNFNNERNRQLQATGMLDAATAQALGLQLGAASGAAGINTGNADRGLQSGIARAGFSAGDLDRGLHAQGLQGDLLSRAGSLRGQGLDRGMAATGAMAGLDQQNFQNQLAGAGATLQAGGMMDEQAQKLRQDDINLYYALDNAGWDRLAMLEAGAGGAAGPYGQQQSVSRTSNPMAAIGALGSAAGGMKSDMRLKEDIRRVGSLDNGLAVYAYRYKEGGPTVIGVMAQEVLAVNPDAVAMEADGFYAVNYDLAVEGRAA